MGGAWAYEALSFGGYWAWDPVENMSLVPWLVLIAGIHANLIAKQTGHSIKSTYIFYLLAFILIVYSTFLTRSGVLGDTSVHAFTEMGLEAQLIGLRASFTFPVSAGYSPRRRRSPCLQRSSGCSSARWYCYFLQR
jgi:cytochrome c-type biogenesis protein CcmF